MFGRLAHERGNLLHLLSGALGSIRFTLLNRSPLVIRFLVIIPTLHQTTKSEDAENDTSEEADPTKDCHKRHSKVHLHIFAFYHKVHLLPLSSTGSRHNKRLIFARSSRSTDYLGVVCRLFPRVFQLRVVLGKLCHGNVLTARRLIHGFSAFFRTQEFDLLLQFSLSFPQLLQLQVLHHLQLVLFLPQSLVFLLRPLIPLLFLPDPLVHLRQDRLLLGRLLRRSVPVVLIYLFVLFPLRYDLLHLQLCFFSQAFFFLSYFFSDLFALFLEDFKPLFFLFLERKSVNCELIGDNLKFLFQSHRLVSKIFLLLPLLLQFHARVPLRLH